MTDLRGLDPCVHCGFCLQACPTFVATGDEADSPRGRIVLMQQIDRGHLDGEDPTALQHLDRCLGCRGCETACPSGVAYGAALEHMRARIAEHRPPPWIARLTLAVVGEPLLRRPILAMVRSFRRAAGWLAGRGRVRSAFAMLAASRMRLPPTLASDAREPVAAPPTAPGPSERQAVVFTGCIMEGLFGHVNRATARVLAANGYRIGNVPAQQCCGALHAHAGALDDARDLARRNVEAFLPDGDAMIAVNSAGCGAMLKEYPRILEGDPLAAAAAAFGQRVRDVSELLADRPGGPRPGAPLPLRVAYDPPCHLEHAQRVTVPPRRIMEAIPELELVPHQEPDQCCGGAGMYTLLQPTLSQAVRDRKIGALRAAKPHVITSGNPGCILQIGAGIRAAGDTIPVMHPVELLDDSYRRAGYYRREPAPAARLP